MSCMRVTQDDSSSVIISSMLAPSVSRRLVVAIASLNVWPQRCVNAHDPKSVIRVPVFSSPNAMVEFYLVIGRCGYLSGYIRVCQSWSVAAATVLRQLVDTVVATVLNTRHRQCGTVSEFA